MAKTEIPFENYLSDISPEYVDIVTLLHEFLLRSGCAVKLQAAKSGHVVSYSDPRTKKAAVNFVSRKQGPVVRIYGDHSGQYADLIASLPQPMRAAIGKAPVCKRLHDPTKCNSRCPMGYVLSLEGAEHKKCRYSCFMFGLNESSAPYIQQLIARELSARSA